MVKSELVSRKLQLSKEILMGGKSTLSLLKGFAAASALLLLSACGGDSNNEARLRVFHASPDAPNVDVLVDGGKVLENVPYAAASDFLGVDPGERRLQVNVAGTNTSAIDTKATLGEDKDYLVVAAGKVADIGPLVFEANRAAPKSGSAKVRVLHSAASAPAVDVYVTAPGAGIAEATPTLANVPFKAISDYLTVPSGTYDVAVTVAGTKTVAIESKGLKLADRLVATVAALDAKGGGAPFSLAVLDER